MMSFCCCCFFVLFILILRWLVFLSENIKISTQYSLLEVISLLDLKFAAQLIIDFVSRRHSAQAAAAAPLFGHHFEEDRL